MAESNKEVSSAHALVKLGSAENAANQTASLQRLGTDTLRHTRAQQNNFLNLRARSLIRSSLKYPSKRRLQKLSKTICKPVTINLTKLPVSNSSESSMRHTLRSGLNRNNKWVKPPRKQVPKKRDTEKQTNNLLESVRQPYIRLQRIDEVINKIALTFARVIPNKKCEASVSMHVEETQTDLRMLKLEPAKAVQENDIESSCFENIENEISSTSDSEIANTIENESFENDFPIVKKLSEKSFKKRQTIKYFSDSSNSTDVESVTSPTSRKVKRVKLEQLNKETCLISDNACNVSEKTIQEYGDSTLQAPIPETPSISEQLCDPSDKQNVEGTSEHTDNVTNPLSSLENLVPESHHDNTGEKMEESCTSENILQSTVTDIKENDVTPKVDNDSDAKTKESTLKDNNCLIGKYKLLKKLRVFLIKCDALKDSFNNSCSALEVEQLTKKQMNGLINSKSINAPYFGKCRINAFKNEDSAVTSGESEKPIISTRSRAPVLLNTSSLINLTPTKRISNNNSVGMQNASKNLLSLWETDSFNKSSEHSSSQKCRRTSKNVEQSPSKQPKKPTRSSVILLKPQIKLNKESTSTVKKTKSDLLLSPEVDRESQNMEKLKNFPQTVLLLQNKTVPKKQKVDSERIEPSISYKCIVCDKCFDNYPDLQKHLSVHTQRLSIVTLNSLENVGPSNEQQNNSVPLEEKEVVQHSPSPNYDQQSTHIKESSPTKAVSEKDSSLNANSPQKRKISPPEKEPGSNKKKKKRAKHMLNPTNDCGICSKAFSTKADLAAHIFLHTETELQEAYERARRSLQTKEDKVEKKNKSKSVTKNVSKETENATNESEEVVILTAEKTVTSRKASSSKEQVTPLPVEKATSSSKPNTIENGTDVVEVIDIQNKTEQQTSNKSVVGRPITICECHDKYHITEDIVQIEIVLLCNTCRKLFRSIECFETHYRLPEHSLCNQNRSQTCRTPKLFCVNCGMICTSLQEIRQHLQLHLCLKQTCVMDFRCNICKVVFVGIGSLFYLHWSKHSKDPFWIASETSFPKVAVIKSLAERKSNDQTDSYFHVAEYVCPNCRTPFVSDDSLKYHKLLCRASTSTEVARSVVPAQPIQKRQLICSLCNGTFEKKLEFYEHARVKHNYGTEPQSVNMSFTNAVTVFICCICLEISETKEQFTEHWLKHKPFRETFTCTHCNMDNDSLDSFLEHVKIHSEEIKDGTPSCRVTFKEVEFTCKICKIGFESLEKLIQHSVIHRTVNNLVVNNSDSSKAPLAESVLEAIKSANPSDLQEQIQTPEVEVIKDKAAEEKKTKKKSPTNEDGKEKSVNRREEDDDSEHELVIDLTGLQEEEETESSEKEKRITQSSHNVPVATSSKKVVNKVSQDAAKSSASVTEAQTSSATSSKMDNIEKEVTKSNNAEQKVAIECNNTEEKGATKCNNTEEKGATKCNNTEEKGATKCNNTEEKEATKCNNTEEKEATKCNDSGQKETVASKESQGAKEVKGNDSSASTSANEKDPAGALQDIPPVKPKGFLRVKPLAELTAKTLPPKKNSHSCFCCGHATSDDVIRSKHNLKHLPKDVHTNNRKRELRSKEFYSWKSAAWTSLKNAQLSTSLNNPQPSTSLNNPQPSTSLNNPQPSTSLNNPQPSTSSNHSQLWMSLNNPQPSTSLNNPQPSTSLNNPQPSTSLNNPQPSTSSNHSQLWMSLNNPQPSTSLNNPQPSTSLNNPQPSTSINNPQPSTSSKHSQLWMSLNNPQPSTSSKYSQPSTSLNNPQPSTSLNNPQPSTSLNNPQPSTSSKYSQPSTSSKNSQPSTNSNQPRQPTTLVIHAVQPFQNTMSNVATPTSVADSEYIAMPLEQVTPIYHKNLPAYNTVRTSSAQPRFAPKNVLNVWYSKGAPNANLTTTPTTSSTDTTVGPTQHKHRVQTYNCSMCHFQTDTLSEYLKHELSDSHAKMQCKNTVNQGKSTGCNQVRTQVPLNTYPQMQTKVNQPQQIYYANPPVQQVPGLQPGPSSSIYCNNSSGGGMSIIIQKDGSTTNVHSMPNTIQHTEQQQLYATQMYNTVPNVTYAPMKESQVQWAIQTNMPGLHHRADGNVGRWNSTLPPTPIACRYCVGNVLFSSELDLHVHVRVHHNFTCRICNSRFYNVNEFHIHLTLHKSWQMNRYF